MTELNILLLNWQVEALESAAFSRSVTMAYLLRRLIHNCIEGLDGRRCSYSLIHELRKQRTVGPS